MQQAYEGSGAEAAKPPGFRLVRFDGRPLSGAYWLALAEAQQLTVRHFNLILSTKILEIPVDPNGILKRSKVIPAAARGCAKRDCQGNATLPALQDAHIHNHTQSHTHRDTHTHTHTHTQQRRTHCGAPTYTE